MSTPPIPQTTVSQSGMLSRSPGAKNLPSAPMMMPAMITPMMSTGDPFHCWDGLVPRRSRVPVRPRAQSQMATMAQLRVADHSLNTCRDPTSRAGHGKADPAGSSWRLAAVTWRSRLASWEPASALVHLHRMRSGKPARGQDREGHEAIRRARTTARHHEGVGRALRRWRLRDPDQGPPERLAAGRLRGPDGHRQAGRDRPAWSGPGPVLAPRAAGPDSVAGPGTGRDPTAPPSSRRACRRVRAAAVTALDRLAVPGGMHPRPSGRRPELITRREQSVLEGVLNLLTGLLQVALGLVALALGLQLLVIGGPAESFFGLPLELLGLVLGLVISSHKSILRCRAVPSCFPASQAPKRGGFAHGCWRRRSVRPHGQATVVSLPAAGALEVVGGGQDDGVVLGPQP